MFTALYKTYQGTEFLSASIMSIYDQMDKIVFVHSDISWTGKKGNTVKSEVIEWKNKFDKNDKIINIDFDTTDQEEQYRIGFEHIKKKFPTSKYILLIDTDEVWDYEHLYKSKLFIENDRGYINSWKVGLKTYIKSPYYLIDPPEPLKPVTFIRTSIPSIKGARGHLVSPQNIIPNVHFHHFSYVRKDFKTILNKMDDTHKGDSDGTKRQVTNTNLKNWIEKWKNLPRSVDFHPAAGVEANWKKIRVIDDNELPKAITLHKDLTPIVNQKYSDKEEAYI